MNAKNNITTTSYLAWDQFQYLVASLESNEDYKMCLMVSIGVFTGLRISDILNRTWQDFSSDYFRLVETKTKKNRRVKVNKTLSEIVKRCKAALHIESDDQLIFINRFGTKAIDKNYVNRRLKEVFEYYKIETDGNISSHLFRKTLGRRHMEMNNYSDAALIMLMELFGHSSPMMTKKYLGIREQEVMSVYDSLSL